MNSLLGIKLSHYAAIDAQNFAQLVDELGGIDVNLPEDIVDAQAGDMRLSAGEQTLGGEQAVFACRADDYAVNAEETRGKVQALVAVALMQKATSVEGGFGYYMRMDGLANLVQTDMDVKAIGAFLESIRSISAENMQVAALPTYSAQSSGKTYQVPVDDAITEMMNRIRAGETPQANAADVLGSIDAGSYTVSVYNGGDVVGAASEAADMLRQVGFNVTDTGNTSMQVYDETLVVYGDADKENAANAVVAGGLSVRQTEALVKKLSAENKPEKEPDPQRVDYTAAAQRDLTSRLGRGVRIVSGRKKGRIELEYYGVDDLNDLLEALALLRVYKSKEATSERT